MPRRERPPELFRYVAIDEYLQDWQRWHNRSRPNLSTVRYVAQKSGLTPGAVSLIFNGKRNPGAASVRKLANAFVLDAERTEYLVVLAEIRRSRTVTARSRWLSKAFGHPGFLRVRALDQHFVDYMTQWHHACLLYTSPSPRDQRGSRMPSSA